MAKNKVARAVKELLRDYFNVWADKDSEKEVVDEITQAISFRGANLWVLIFAVFIASLGLNINSTAVIIGAMLISPLMGPIVGMGLGVGINNFILLRKSFNNYMVATLISVLTATLYFLISPISDAQSELLARTTPTIYDVLIAFCGGAAGFVAIATKGKSNVIPGVAIATALMPPLCTAGYGLAQGSAQFFFGAFYLFFINTVFIGVATYLGVRVFRFKQKVFADDKRRKRVHQYIIALMIVTMTPAVYLTMGIVKDSIVKNNVALFVRSNMYARGTQILSNSFDQKEKTIEIVAVGKPFTQEFVKEAEQKLSQFSLEGYRLVVIQGEQTDSLLINQKFDELNAGKKEVNAELLQNAQTIKRLQQELKEKDFYKQKTADVAKELQPLFPQISSLALQQVDEHMVKQDSAQQFVVAIVGVNRRMKNAEKQQLIDWLKIRTKTDSLQVIFK